MAGSDDRKSSERALRDSRSKKAEENLLRLADSLYGQFQRGVVPHISLPSRTKGNIEFSTKDDVWIYGDQETMRSVKTVRGAKTLL
jgi:DNA topoisomerase-6 subunit A